MRHLVSGLLAAALLAVPAAVARQRPVVVVDHGARPAREPRTEPIGPGSSTRKIKDGGGTRGVASGLREAELNLRVGLRLRALLEAAGVRVVMTRTKTGTSMGNVARARIANRADAALLRIHADGSGGPRRARHAHAPPVAAGGVDDVYADSKRAARIVQVISRSARLSGSRAAGARGFHRLQLVRRAVILVEMGFMTNPTEDQKLLARVSYQRRAALGLCRGALLPPVARRPAVPRSRSWYCWSRATARSPTRRAQNPSVGP